MQVCLVFTITFAEDCRRNHSHIHNIVPDDAMTLYMTLYASEDVTQNPLIYLSREVVSTMMLVTR